MSTAINFKPGYLLPPWRPVRRGEPKLHLRLRLLLYNAAQPGHKPDIYLDIEKPLREILRRVNPECRENDRIARHSSRYLEEKCRGSDEPAVNRLVCGTIDELTKNIEQTKAALRDELVEIRQAARHNLVTAEVVRINSRYLARKYSIYLYDFLFGQSCADYARSAAFLDYAMSKPGPEPSLRQRRALGLTELEALKAGQAPRTDCPAAAAKATKPDLPSRLRASIFENYGQELFPGHSRGKYLRAIYNLQSKGSTPLHPALLARANELVCGLNSRQIERMGFRLDWLARAEMELNDLVAEAFSILGITRENMVYFAFKEKLSHGRNNIFAVHPRGEFLRTMYRQARDNPQEVERKKLAEAKQLICSLSHRDLGRMRIWHSGLDFVAHCLPFFKLNRRDFRSLDWTTTESGKANVVYRFYKYNPDLRSAIEAAEKRLAAIKSEDQLEPGELERLAQLRDRLIKLITKNNLVKWGLDTHRRCPGIQSNTKLIKNCFPFTAHPVFERFPWPQKRTRLDTIIIY
ncbi:MAG: hypothetical protein JW873_04125 [Candidatus Saganbacteria bacterium]|nr:hypothetical protein [Candidatus Saganbacteria bacterium]